jgi:hypothetical protein
MRKKQLSLIDEESAKRLATVTAEIAKRGVPQNTRRAYDKAWKEFCAYCEDQGRRALPASPKTIAEYLVAEAARDRAIDTLRVIKAAIARNHRDAAFGDPTADNYVRDTWRGLLTDVPATAYHAVATQGDDIRAMVDAIDAELNKEGAFAPQEIRLAAARDRAIILTMYEGALSLQELSSLLREKMEPTDAGVRTQAWRSPDRREAVRSVDIGYGRTPYCPIAALNTWTKVAAIKQGPVFRKIDLHGHVLEEALTPRGIAFILGERGKAAGVDVHKNGLLGSRAIKLGRLIQARLDGENDQAIFKRSGLHEVSKPRILQAVKKMADST